MTLDKHEIEAIAEALANKLITRIQSGPVTPRLLTIKQAADYLGRSPGAVYQLINRRTLVCVKEGRRVHIDRADLEQFVEQGKADTA